jgi:hypothetical protein
MRSPSRLLLAAAATSGACLALVLAVGVCTASCGGGLAAHGHGRRQPRPPSSAVLGVDSQVTAPALQEKGFAAAAAGARRGGRAGPARRCCGGGGTRLRLRGSAAGHAPPRRNRADTAQLADHSIVVPSLLLYTALACTSTTVSVRVYRCSSLSRSCCIVCTMCEPLTNNTTIS